MIVLPDYYNVVGLIAKQAREMGITSQFLGGDGWESEELTKIGGNAVDGALYINHYYSADSDAAVKTFVDSYKKELETLTSKEIIDKSYETTMKEELMCLFYPESQRYDLDEIKALKNEKNSLETLYQGWMDSDLNINQLLEDNTDEIVAELAEEYKAKQSKKKAKER